MIKPFIGLIILFLSIYPNISFSAETSKSLPIVAKLVVYIPGSVDFPYDLEAWKRSCCVGRKIDFKGENNVNRIYKPHPYCINLEEFEYISDKICSDIQN